MAQTNGRIAAERLIIFTRYPLAGSTKTRLIPALGPEGAAKLQRRMTEHILSVAREVRKTRNLAIEIGFAGGSRTAMARWLGDDLEFQPQTRGDIGRRMAAALLQAFSRPAQRAVLIGSDIPGITPEILHAAFDRLDHSGLVLGPARDGGYYLIALGAAGARKLIPGIFREIPWSTADVYAATRRKARQLGVSVYALPLLSDVDRPEDLVVWERIGQ